MQTIQSCGLSDDYKHICFKDLEGYLNVDNFLDILKGFSELEINEIRRILGINPKVNIDPQLNQYSNNPVANNAIFCALAGKVDKNRIANIAISGKYKDLKNAPCSLPNPEGLVIQDSNGEYKIYDGTEAIKVTIPQSLRDFSDWKDFYVDYSKIEDLIPLKSINLNGVALPINDDKSVSIKTLTWEEINKKLLNYISQDDWCVIKALIELDYIFKIKESEVKLCNKIKLVNSDLQTLINGFTSIVTDLKNRIDTFTTDITGRVNTLESNIETLLGKIGSGGVDSRIIQLLKDDIAELQSYHQVYLNVSATPTIFSKLNTLHSFDLSWHINKSNYKNPIVVVNGKQYPVNDNSNSITITDDFTDNIYIQVSMTNDVTTASNSTVISAVYPIFYGTSNNYLENNLKLYSSSGQFTTTANTDLYIYVMSPKEITFFVNGFEGGFEKLQSITIKDNNNKDVQYFVYKSENSNLGQTSVQWQLR